MGNAERYSRWEMPKRLLGAIVKAIGKLLGNVQIKLIPAGKMLLLARCDENARNEAVSQ